MTRGTAYRGSISSEPNHAYVLICAASALVGDTDGMPDVIRFSKDVAESVTTYGAEGTQSVHIGTGSGESHAYVLHFDPGGQIGSHEAGFDQLFLVVSGEAWLTVDGVTAELEQGDAGVVPRGSVHSKGSADGATVVMIQMRSMTAE